MKRKLSGMMVVIVSLLILLLLSGCMVGVEKQPPVVYTSVCGDSVCSPGELGKCDIDCEIGSLQAGTDMPQTDPNQVALDDIRNKQRTYTSEDRLSANTTNQAVAEDMKISTESIQTYVPSIGFRVANRYNLLSLNESIAGIMGTLTGAAMPQVLGGGRLSSATPAFGIRAAFYEQLLTLRSGRVVFGLEESSDRITTYLVFKKGEPIFDYTLGLRGGMFKFFENESINLLGHHYIIQEVTNTSMTLIGLTTPDKIMFRNAKGIYINDKYMSPEALNVTLTREYLRVIINADEDISILPGESLVSKLDRPEMLLTNRIDLEYNGLSDAPSFPSLFDKNSGRYKLHFTNNLNMSYTVPLANLNPFKTGNEENSFVFQEGASNMDYNIKAKDYFVLTNNREIDGLTNILKLKEVDEEDQLITFEDLALEPFYVYYQGNISTGTAYADLVVHKVIHKVRIGPNETITVDLNGDGAINGGKASIVMQGNTILRMSSGAENLTISILTPKVLRENANIDLVTIAIITQEGISIPKSSLVMEEEGDDYLIGLNDFGALFTIKDNIDDEEQRGDDLLMISPAYQRFAEVIVKAYE